MPRSGGTGTDHKAVCIGTEIPTKRARVAFSGSKGSTAMSSASGIYSAPFQNRERRGEAERLVAELVAGDQQDGARAPQRLGERFVDALLHTSISTSAPVTRAG